MTNTAENLILSANLIALAVYGFASLYFILRFLRQHSLSRQSLLATTGIALVFHGIGVFGMNFHTLGFHLSYFGVSSLIFWAMNLLLLVSSLKKELHNLFLLIWVDQQNVYAVITHLSNMLHLIAHLFIHLRCKFLQLYIG